MNGSPAPPEMHVAADPFGGHVYWLQSESLLQVVLGGGVLIAGGDAVNVGGGAAVGIATAVLVVLGSHPIATDV